MRPKGFRSWLFGAMVPGIVAGVAATGLEDVECEVADGSWAQLTPGGVSAFNVTNVTVAGGGSERAVLDLVLYVDRADVLLPNGMLLRVVTADYEGLEVPELSLDGLMDMQQSLWEIIFGNILGTIICCVLVGLLLYLEKKYECIGGEQLHDLADKQHELHDDLEHAIQFLRTAQEDPMKLNGKARIIALAYNAAVGAENASEGIEQAMEEVR